MCYNQCSFLCFQFYKSLIFPPFIFRSDSRNIEGDFSISWVVLRNSIGHQCCCAEGRHKVFFGLFGGHTWQYLETTLGTVLKGHSWHAQGNIWFQQLKPGLLQAKYQLNMSSYLSDFPPIFFIHVCYPLVDIYLSPLSRKIQKTISWDYMTLKRNKLSVRRHNK